MIRWVQSGGTYREVGSERLTGDQRRRQKRLAAKQRVKQLKLKRRDEAIVQAVAAVKELAAE